jgi:hypothetical protein
LFEAGLEFQACPDVMRRITTGYKRQDRLERLFTPSRRGIPV